MDEKEGRIRELYQAIEGLEWQKCKAVHARDYAKREWLNYQAARKSPDFRDAKWPPEKVKEWQTAAEAADAEYEKEIGPIDQQIAKARAEIYELGDYSLRP